MTLSSRRKKMILRTATGALILPTILNTWKPLKLGNGGLIIRLDIADDGTMVCSTDSFGSYLWSASQNQWVQLFKATALPASVLAELLNGNTGSLTSGPDDIIIDHSNSNNIWLHYRGNIFKSTDKGATFLATGFVTQFANLSSNSGSGKEFQPYCAIDPNNSSVGYFSTSATGLFRTIDGGTTFSQVTALSAALPVATGQAPSVIQTAGTDSTSVTIGTGVKTFSNNSGSFGFNSAAAHRVKVWRTSDPTQQMVGTANSSGTTFTLTVPTTPGSTQGSGTFSDWTVGPFMDDQNSNRICGGHRIVFDKSGGTTTVSGQTRTANIFVHTYGINTWKSTDGGVTWTATSATNKPPTIAQMCCDASGVLWAIDDRFLYSGVAVPTNTTLSKYSGTTWTPNIASVGTNSGTWFQSVAVDPLNAGHIVATIGGTPFQSFFSTDSFASWNASAGANTYASSGDVDWIKTYFDANPNGNFFSNCVNKFDPAVSGKLWVAAEGVWYTTPPASASPLAFTQQTRGIEEFVAIRIVCPSGGKVFMTAWDFPTFYSANFNAYPSVMTGQPGSAQPNVLLRGYDIDYVWNATNTLVNVVGSGSFGNDDSLNYSGITTTGGATTSAWTRFSGHASISIGGDAGGHIAASDANHIVYVPTNSQAIPLHSTDGGATWASISISGGTPTAAWGPVSNSAPASKTLITDKGNGDFYLFNINVNNAGPQGMYRSQDGGVTWAARTAPTFASQYSINEQLKSSGIAGVLFFTPGQQGASYPTSTPFYYSNDGGNSWNTVANFQQVITFGFGAISQGLTFPNIFAAGWYNGVYAIWRCQNFNSATGAGTWTQLGEQFPCNVMGFPTDIDGDKATPGQVYVFGNGGAFYGTFT